MIALGDYLRVFGRGRVRGKRFLIVAAWRRDEIAQMRKRADRLVRIFVDST